MVVQTIEVLVGNYHETGGFWEIHFGDLIVFLTAATAIVLASAALWRDYWAMTSPAELVIGSGGTPSDSSYTGDDPTCIRFDFLVKVVNWGGRMAVVHNLDIHLTNQAALEVADCGGTISYLGDPPTDVVNVSAR